MIVDPQFCSLSQSDFDAFDDIDKILFYIAEWFDYKYQMYNIRIIYRTGLTPVIRGTRHPPHTTRENRELWLGEKQYMLHICMNNQKYSSGSRIYDLYIDYSCQKLCWRGSKYRYGLTYNDDTEPSFDVLMCEPDAVERFLKRVSEVVDADMRRKNGDTE